jgi:uncharacterized protein YjbJ (UPF0337 family)
MNWDKVEGEWKQLKGHIKAKWAKLTDDDLKMLEAKKDALVGKLQERYGVAREEAERQADDWIATMGPQPPEQTRVQPPKEAVKERGR